MSNSTFIHTAALIDERWGLMEIKVTRDLLDHYRKLKQEMPVLEMELQMMKKHRSRSRE